jgi:hypothetical protein
MPTATGISIDWPLTALNMALALQLAIQPSCMFASTASLAVTIHSLIFFQCQPVFNAGLLVKHISSKESHNLSWCARPATIISKHLQLCLKLLAAKSLALGVNLYRN